MSRPPGIRRAVSAETMALRERPLPAASRARALAAALLWAALVRAARADADGVATPRREAPPVLVEAERPRTLSADPSSFKTTIEMEERRAEARSVPEIVGDAVGVQVRQFGGLGDPAEISIRGSTSSQVVVLLDGVRLNNAQSGAVDLSTIPRELIERIEITRGGGSVDVGSDAIGGVINIVTRRPSAEPSTTLAGLAGSWDTWGGSASQTGAWRGFELSAGYEGFTTDGNWRFQPARREVGGVPLPTPPGTIERVNNAEDSHSALLRVGRDLGEWGRLTFTDSYTYREGGEPGPDSGGGALAGQSLTAKRRRTRNAANLLLEVTGRGERPPSGQLRVFHRYDRSRFKDAEPRVGSPFDSDNRNHAAGGRLEASRTLRFLSADHTASLGAELRYDALRSKSFANPDRYVTGVFLENEIAWLDGRLRLVPALRWDYTQGFGNEWIPRVGAVFDLFPWLRFKGNIERAYRVPNYDELFLDEEFLRGNPNLDPEDSLNFDVGFELGWDEWSILSDLSLEFAAFRNEIDESIVFQSISNVIVAATNTGESVAEGIELSGGFRALGWIGFSGNWTHLESNIRGLGQPLPGRAEDEYVLRAEIGPPDGAFEVSGEQRYTSSFPANRTGAVRVQSRTVYDLSLVVTDRVWPPLTRILPGRSLVFSVSAFNVTDESVRDAVFFPQPGRNLRFRLEWKW